MNNKSMLLTLVPSPDTFVLQIMNAGARDEDSILSIKTGTRIFIGDIVGQDFWDLLKDGERMMVGAFVMKMIQKNLLRVEFLASESDETDALAKSKKVTRKK